MPRPYISPPSFLRRPAVALQYITIYLDSTLYGGKGDVGLSPEEEYNVRHQAYVMEMPQSGERFRGRENMRAFQRARSDHSTPPRSADQRAARREDVAGAVGRADGTSGYGSRISRGVRDDHGQSCVDE